MTCKNIFKFQKRNGEKTPAIWFRLHGRYVKIFPLVLYDVLWHDYESLSFSSGIESTFYTFNKMVSGYFRDRTCEDYHIYFQRKTFTETAIRALTELCNAALVGLPTAYDDFRSQAAEQMLIGLNKVATHGIHSGSHATEHEQHIKSLESRNSKLNELSDNQEYLNTKKYLSEVLEVGHNIYHKIEKNECIINDKDFWVHRIFYCMYTDSIKVKEALSHYRDLSTNERIFVMVDESFTKKDTDIAVILDISPTTVRTRRTKLKNKLLLHLFPSHPLSAKYI